MQLVIDKLDSLIFLIPVYYVISSISMVHSIILFIGSFVLHVFVSYLVWKLGLKKNSISGQEGDLYYSEFIELLPAHYLFRWWPPSRLQIRNYCLRFSSCIGLITDILDGLIARLFNMKTEFGARLDSLADVGLYINALIGGIVFKWEAVAPHAWMVVTFVLFYVAMELMSYLKFRSHASLHLYSSKVGGYIQGVFLFYSL